MKNIILASASPRRYELLDKFGLKFEVVSSSIKEKVNKNEDPKIVAMSLAFEKANSISNIINSNSIIISADTIVVQGNRILEKPQSRNEARSMLKSLSGNEHEVITGISIVESELNIKIIDYEKTYVKFRKLNDDLIEKYLDTDEYKDKAGSYGIQGVGSILVEKINGCYFNVMGLPLYKLDILLRKNFDISLL